MAGTVSLPPADVLLSKRVQEMVINGEEPPHLYICRNGDHHEPDDQDVPSQLSSIPIIDLSLISPSSTSQPSSKPDHDELHRLHSALSSWGCFQVHNSVAS